MYSWISWGRIPQVSQRSREGRFIPTYNGAEPARILLMEHLWGFQLCFSNSLFNWADMNGSPNGFSRLSPFFSSYPPFLPSSPPFFSSSHPFFSRSPPQTTLGVPLG